MIPISTNNYTPEEYNGITINYIGNNTLYFQGVANSSTAINIPINQIVFEKNKTYELIFIISPRFKFISNSGDAIAVAFRNSTLNKNYITCKLVGSINTPSALVARATLTTNSIYQTDILKIGIYSGNGAGYIKIIITEDLNSTFNQINWSSTAGALYGGYIDLVSGELVQTHGIFETT